VVFFWCAWIVGAVRTRKIAMELLWFVCKHTASHNRNTLFQNFLWIVFRLQIPGISDLAEITLIKYRHVYYVRMQFHLFLHFKILIENQKT
jgi:hypothetical protein